MEAIASVNFLAVLAAAIIAMVVGALWYGPLFGSRWMAAAGKRPEDAMTPEAKAAMPRLYGTMFAASLAQAFVLAIFVKWAFATTLVDGAVVGLLAALGLVGPTMLSTVLFEDRKAALFQLSVAYYAVTFALQGALLAAWP